MRSKESDIFSFACTIYEVLVYFLDLSLLFVFHIFVPHKMFTRLPPYEGDSNASDRSKPPARIGLLMGEEWNKLWEILEDCWSTDPLDRPTASELEARLRKVFQPEPLGLDIGINENRSISTMSRSVHNGQKLMEWCRIRHGNFRFVREISKILFRLLMFYCVTYCILFLL